MNLPTSLTKPFRNVLRGKLFYGWVIVLLAFLGNVMSAGPGGYAIGLYYRPMHDELGWDRSTITFALSLAGIFSGLTGPFVGWALDRFGAKPVMVASTTIASLGIMGIAAVQEPWQFYLLYGVVGALGIAEIGSVPSSVALARWWVRKRGRAMAFATMGYSMGGVIFIPLVSAIIEHAGWRTSWVFSGALIFLLVTIPSFLFMRNRPEDMGLQPDGDGPAAAQHPGEERGDRVVVTRPLEMSWTAREAMRTRSFWLLLLSFNFGSMAAGALVVHQIPYMQDKGFAVQAAGVASLVAFIHLIVKPFWGFLIERIHIRYCIMLAFSFALTGVVALRFADTVPLLYLFAVFFGIGNGAFGILIAVSWADYFGRQSIGAIRGITMPFNIMVGAGTPLLAAWISDTYHSYDLVMYIFTVAYVLGIACVFLARPPHKAEPAKAPEILLG